MRLLNLNRFKNWFGIYKILYWVFLLLISFGVFSLYINYLNWTEEGISALEMVYGTAYKPYVFRVLTPLVIRVIISILPYRIETISTIIMFFSLLGFVISFRYLYTTFWRPSIVLDLISLLSVIGLFPIFAINNKIYDFTSLFLFTLCLSLLARKKFHLYMIFFGLTSVNKETAILLILIYFVHYRHRLGMPTFKNLLIYQVSVFLIIRLIIALYFRNNPGGMVEFHFMKFFQLMIFRPHFFIMIFILIGILVLLLFIRTFREKPLFVQNAAIATVPLMSVLYFLIGYPFELRFFIEIYSIFLLIFTQPISRIIGFKLEETQ